MTPDWTAVFIMPPLMDYRDVRTEKELLPNLVGGQATARNVTETASRFLRSSGFKTFDENGLRPDQKKALDESLKSLGIQIDEWVRRSKGKQLPVSFVRQLCSETNAQAVLFNLLKVKLGEGAFWDPNSGMIAPGANTSQIVAFLVDVETGDIVWRNELFLRDKPDTQIFNKSLEMLFSKLPARAKEGTR